MRCLLLSAAGLSLLAAVVGCNHMAGRCDCDSTPTIACPCWAAPHSTVVASPVLKPEAVKEMPKVKPETPDK